jgi:hypothetical protein
MNTIIHYKVVQSTTLFELQKEVDKSIQDGWQPFGSLAAVTPVLHDEEIAPVFAQPMVKS